MFQDIECPDAAGGLDSGGCMPRVLPDSVQFSVAIDSAAEISGQVGTRRGPGRPLA